MKRKFKELLVIARKVFTDQIWDLNMDSLTSVRRRIVRLIKLTRITFLEFAEGRMGFQCVALSYFGALATIPFVAFIFTVTGGLGLSNKVKMMLDSILNVSPVVLNDVMEKANNIINTAKSSTVGLVSGIFFLFTILWLMFQVERVFNNVWKIRKIPRKLYKRFTFYLLLLILSPVVVMLFGSGIALYTDIPKHIGINFEFGNLSTLMTIIGWIVFYIDITLCLSVMYKFIPAAKLKYRNALIAAVVSGFIFTIFQYLYLETQVFVSRLNGVYGAIAIIPLFLIWMNLSWQIVIYGAQLSYGLEHVDKYHIPEGRIKDFTPLRDKMKEENKKREEQA